MMQGELQRGSRQGDLVGVADGRDLPHPGQDLRGHLAVVVVGPGHRPLGQNAGVEGSPHDDRHLAFAAGGKQLLQGALLEQRVSASQQEAVEVGTLEAFETDLIDRAGPGDVVVFHYSGHGHQVTDDEPDEEIDGYDEVLVPYGAPDHSQSPEAVQVAYDGGLHIRDDTLGVLLGAVIVLLYTVSGGFRAVCWTDFLQALLMVGALVVFPVYLLIKFGGYGFLTAALGEVREAVRQLEPRGQLLLQRPLSGRQAGAAPRPGDRSQLP